MSDSSPKLGLVLPTQVDQFSTQDIRQNWEKIDAAPGTFVCNSATRPSWGTAHNGRKIYEADTGLEWVWNGSAFRRLSAQGLLKRSDGSWAIGERTTDFSSSSLTYVIVVSVTNVVIPAGNRPIRVDVSWQAAINVMRNFSMAIFRSATANAGPAMASWSAGTTGQDDSGGGCFFALERNGLAAGTYSFSLQLHSNGPGPSQGTSKLRANTISPITIAVSEI